MFLEIVYVIIEDDLGLEYRLFRFIYRFLSCNVVGISLYGGSLEL